QGCSMRLPRCLFLCLFTISHSEAAVLAETQPARAVSSVAPRGMLEVRDKQVEAIFKDWDTANTPGASVAVIEKGKVVFEKGFGLANLEYGVPIKPETVFHVASVS